MSKTMLGLPMRMTDYGFTLNLANQMWEYKADNIYVGIPDRDVYIAAHDAVLARKFLRKVKEFSIGVEKIKYLLSSHHATNTDD